MKIERHTLASDHVKDCVHCQRRMKFMHRVGLAAYAVALELEMGPEEAIRTLITLAHNLAEQNDCLDDFTEHIAMSAAIIRAEQPLN